MTKPVAFGFMCFCVTLAVLIGQRLSDQAMAVIVGSVIGVAATVPMAALILFMLTRQRESASYGGASPRRDYSPGDEPRMIVIQPQPYAQPMSQYPMLSESPQLNTAAWRQQVRTARDFTIVGEEEFEDEDRNALV